MQSYAAADGTYTLTVTFKIGTDLNFAQVLVQNRVSSAMAQLPQAVQNQGVTVQKKSTSILLFVDADLAGQRLRQPLSDQLRDHQSAETSCRGCPASATSRCSAPGNIRCGCGSIPTSCRRAACAAGRHPGDPAAEPAGHGGPGRHAADAARASRSNTRSTSMAGSMSQAIREHHRQDRQQWRRHARARRRPVELGRADLQPDLLAEQQPAAGIGVFQSPGANALEVEQARREKMAELSTRLPAGHQIRHAFDTTKFVSASINEVYHTLIEAGCWCWS